MRNTSNKTNNTTVTTGTGFFTLLGLIFITLKLAGIGAVASWSWWWVLAPFWGPLAFVIGIVTIVALMSGLVLFIGWVMQRK